MKKIIICFLSAVMVCVLFCGCAGNNNNQNASQAPAQSSVTQQSSTVNSQQPQQPQQSTATQQTNTPVDLAKAKSIALQHAGLAENTVTFTETKLETDDGRQKFDIDFVSGGKKYEYDIDANNGNILESSVKDVSPNGNTATANQAIDLEGAKAIALKHAGFDANSVTFTKQKLDTDDGVQKWEIEFVANGKEYEYDISPADGSILKHSVETAK